MKKIVFVFLLFMHDKITAQSTVTGEYYLQGVMEMASGFLLKPDSTFEFFFSYGALDRYGSGKWSLHDNEIILNSKPKPLHDFKIIKSEKLNNDFTKIKIIDKNSALLNHVFCTIQFPGTTMTDVTDETGEINFSKQGAEKISLTFEFCPEKISVFSIDKNLNYFEFAFEPWIAEVFFTDFHLTLTGKGLTGRHPLLDEKEYHFVKGN